MSDPSVPTRGQMMRLNALVKAAVLHAQDGRGSDSAREAVRDHLGGGKTLVDVANAAGLSKSMLHSMLVYRGGRALHRARRAVEPVLGLPPGGLGMVLAVIEDL